MELKDLFDPAVKEDILARINKLTPDSTSEWGKMNVAQMLAHVQQPIGSAEGLFKHPRSLMGKIFGPIARPGMYSNKPFKRNLPTDKSFIMTGQEKDFEKEKQQLIAMIRNFKEENIVNEIHPFFGKMSKEQWSKAMFKHLDHHLAQFRV